MSELTVIRHARVHAPEDLGVRDILIAGGTIVALQPDLDVGRLDVDELDAEGRLVVPGLVDGHLHIIGGGGNEGYESRIPELWVGELARAGITTVVAPPGIDMVAKNLEAILAKAYALGNEAVSAYAMVGGFQRPFLTLTGSMIRDMFTVERILGIKVALGERRASRFQDHELVELAAQLEWLAGATGKACLMHAHLGEASDPAAQLLHAMRESRVPPRRFQVTHCNFTPDAFEAARQVAGRGGFVDLNPILHPAFGHPDALPAVEAIPQLLDAGVSPDLVTMSTDGNASVPLTGEDGTVGPYEKSLTWLWDAVVALVRRAGLPWAQALSFATTNPARALNLCAKGRIRVGADADLLVLTSELAIDHVFSRGTHLLAGGDPTTMSLYEPQRPAPAYEGLPV